MNDRGRGEEKTYSERFDEAAELLPLGARVALAALLVRFDLVAYDRETL